MARRAVRAAGGVIYRIVGGEAEYLVARRPRYKDWTLPKGKLNRNEGPQEAALREVREETGLSGRTESEVGRISYELGSGRLKAVRYWLMEAEEGEFTVNPEVDKVRWLTGPLALKKLSYRKDQSVLGRAIDMVADPHVGRVHLVRHAPPGTRSKATGDPKRPLSKKGMHQSSKLSRRLSRDAIVEIRSSRLPRCVQTVAQVSHALALGVTRDRRLIEGGSLDGLLELISELSGTTAALCTHGDMMEMMIGHLQSEGIDLGTAIEWRKASVWTFDTYKGAVTAASYRKPPA